MADNAPLDPERTYNLKVRELEVAEARLRQEREVKILELEQASRLKTLELDHLKALKERDLEVQNLQMKVTRWTGPVMVAAVAGALGIGGSLLSSRENRELERKKQEGTVILESIRTGLKGDAGAQQVAANLILMTDAGVITLNPEKVAKLRELAGGATAALPIGNTPLSGSSIPEPMRQQILNLFRKYGAYFAGLGLKSVPELDVQAAPSDVAGVLAYYDLAKKSVFIDAAELDDPNLALREFSHAVLYDDAKSKKINFDQHWAYIAIESGLASYFASSFRNDPSIPAGRTGKGGAPSLDNSRKLNTLKAGNGALWDGMAIWGATFWDLRTQLGQQTADMLLLQTWSQTTTADIDSNDTVAFTSRLLALDAQLNAGKNSEKIRAVLKNRGAAVP